jgi:hypothetical protein
MELAGKMPPEVSLTMLDLLVESMDIPNREELVKRIRQINGQKDPDATEPTPEEMQREQAQAQQQQFNDEMSLAQLAEQKAKARKAEAEAAVAEANAQKIGVQTVREGVGAIKEATDAATAVAFMPELAGLSDGILREAGWKEPDTPQGTDPQGIPYIPKTIVPNAGGADGAVLPQQPAPDGTIQNGAIPNQPMQ